MASIKARKTVAAKIKQMERIKQNNAERIVRTRENGTQEID